MRSRPTDHMCARLEGGRPADPGICGGSEAGAMTSENQASENRSPLHDPFGGDGHPVRRAPLWNIANVLTIGRLILVPVFVAALLTAEGQHTGWRLTAAGIFLLAALTDRLDGLLARRYHLITDFGKLADPIADKALIGAGLIGLSLLGELWWWVTIVILVRELGITVARLALAQRVVLPAGRGGKVKTLLQVVAILLLLVFPTGPAAILGIVVMGAAVVVTVATGVDYAVSMTRVARR